MFDFGILYIGCWVEVGWGERSWRGEWGFSYIIHTECIAKRTEICVSVSTLVENLSFIHSFQE